MGHIVYNAELSLSSSKSTTPMPGCGTSGLSPWLLTLHCLQAHHDVAAQSVMHTYCTIVRRLLLQFEGYECQARPFTPLCSNNHDHWPTHIAVHSEIAAIRDTIGNRPLTFTCSRHAAWEALACSPRSESVAALARVACQASIKS